VIASGAMIITTGSLMAMWGGRVASTIVFLSGTAQLWPPPPGAPAVLVALGVYLAAMVMLIIGEFIAFYLAVLDQLPKDIKGVAEAKKVQSQAIEMITKAATGARDIIRTTGGVSPGR
jgi:hypothetical protein